MAVDLVAGTFEPHVGTAFRTAGVDLLLSRVERGRPQPGAPREEPFTLVFTAPAGTAVAQVLCTLTHDELGALEVFLVPRQPGHDGLPVLDAVFN